MSEEDFFVGPNITKNLCSRLMLVLKNNSACHLIFIYCDGVQRWSQQTTWRPSNCAGGNKALGDKRNNESLILYVVLLILTLFI